MVEGPALTRSSWRSRIALLGAVFAAHAPALRDGFVLDDRNLLADNPYLRTLSGLGFLLRHELFVASAQPRIVPYYRPLSGLLYWTSFQLFGASAPLQHALNVLLHAAVVVLLHAALRLHLVRGSIALGAALVLAVHPATAEVVAYIGGRQDMLGWLVGLGAVILLPRARSIVAALALGFGASLVGALCHELFVALFVPLALLALGEGRPGSRVRGAAILAGGVAAVGSLLALRSWLGLVAFETHLDGPVRLVEASVGVGLRLLRDVVLPTDLAVDVTVSLPGAALASVCTFSFALAAGGLAAAVRQKRRELYGMTLAGFSIAALSAVLHAGVVQKYGFISDRYAYAMLIGLILATACIAEAYVVPAADDSPALVTALRKWGAAAVAVAVVPLTWAREASWYDERSLQTAMIADRPADPESRLAAGMMFFTDGDIEQAYPHCRAYAETRPGSEKPNLCVGSWLLIHRRPAEAVTYLRPYALSRPGMETARRAFLAALLASRQYDEARATVDDWSRVFSGATDLAEARATLASLPGDGSTKR
jgi:hypothetical protein